MHHDASTNGNSDRIGACGLPVTITTARGPLLELDCRDGRVAMRLPGLASTELTVAAADALRRALPGVIARAFAQQPDATVVRLPPPR